MNLTTETLQSLMEAGYVAAGRGLAPLAERIFAGVEAARPDSDAPAIGRAVLALNVGDAAAAVELLRGALAKHPDSDVTKSFLGLALRQAGLNQQCEQVLGDVVGAGRDPAAKALAEAILHPADE